LKPDDDWYRRALGVAQYRAGQYPEAAASLGRDSQPAGLAFLAMAQHQLGRKEQARATLASLREGMKKRGWDRNEELRGFLREAEALIEPPGDGPNK
jgi:hypothetical protein